MQKMLLKNLLPFFYSKLLTYLYPTPRVKKRNRYTHDHILASMAFSITIHVLPKSEIKKRKIGFISILEAFQSSSKLNGGEKKKVIILLYWFSQIVN